MCNIGKGAYSVWLFGCQIKVSLTDMLSFHNYMQMQWGYKNNYYLENHTVTNIDFNFLAARPCEMEYAEKCH